MCFEMMHSVAASLNAHGVTAPGLWNEERKKKKRVLSVFAFLLSGIPVAELYVAQGLRRKKQRGRSGEHEMM